MSNPLKTWWQVKKLFKFPEIKMSCGKIENTTTGHFYSSWYDKNSNFYLKFSDVIYKWKFDDICLECPPYIVLVLFKKYRLSIIFEGLKKDFHTYWDALLTCLYIDNKNIRKTKQEYSWVKYLSNDEGDYDTITCWTDDILTKYAINLTKDIIK